MLNDHHQAALAGEATMTKLSAQLRALQPKRRIHNEAMFAAHYNDVVDAIERGVSVKRIRETLAESGLALSPATFKRLLRAEAERRNPSPSRADEPSLQGGDA